MQLELKLTEPTAKVVPFPLGRNVGLARQTAQRLVVLRGAAADAHWRRVTDRLFRHLVAAGVPEHCAEAELESFAALVQSMIDRSETAEVG